MMEVSQSAPLADFKEIVSSKTNGVLPAAAMVQEDIEDMEKLCFPDSEENASINDKVKPTSNGKVDLVEMLTKDDIETDNLLQSDSINGEDEGDGNILATEDIDMLAEEFLNEIAEEDNKTEDSISDSRVESELLGSMEQNQVQEEKSLIDDKSEMNSSKTEETETDKKIDILEKINATEEEPMDEDFDELPNIDDPLESDIPDLHDGLEEENNEVSDKALSTLEESDELMDVDKETENQKPKEDDHRESNDCKTNDGDACANDNSINESESCGKEISEKEADKEMGSPVQEVQTQNTESIDKIPEISKDLETEKELSEDKCTTPVDTQESVQNSDNNKELPNLDESECEPTTTDKNPVSDVITIEDDKNESQDQLNVEQKNNEEDTFMSELSAAIDEHENSSEKDSPDKSKIPEDCDIINLDSPLGIEDDNKAEASTSKLAEDELEGTDTQPQNDEKDQSEKDAEEALHSDDDDIMLVDSVNEEKCEKENLQGDSKTETEENNKENEKEIPSMPDKFHPEPSDTEDDDVVLVDDKTETDVQDEKQSNSIEKKSQIESEGENADLEEEKDTGNASDDDVVLLEDEKEDAGHQLEEETSLDGKKCGSKEILDEEEKEANEELSHQDDEKDRKKRSERKLSSVDEKKNDYVSDDDIVLLEDDDKEEEKPTESKPINDKELLSGKTEDQRKDLDVDQSCTENRIKEESKNDTKNDKISDDEDDDVVLLDDEKDEESDVKCDKKDEKSSEENSKGKIVDDSPIEEEIFSIDTSVTERQKVEQSLKDDDDDDVVVLDNETPEKKEKESKEKIDLEKESETKTAASTEKSCSGKENDKIITRSRSRKSSKEVETETEKDDVLVPDNSDNAQDKFPEKTAEDDFSNNDGDNNLLQEGEPPQNSCSNDEEKQKFEVESSEIENSTEPPQKKLRVEGDETSQSSLLGESKEQFKANNIEEREKSLKRSLSPDSSSQDSKKLKTESKEEPPEIDCKDALIKTESDELLVPTPAPVKKVDLNLDFLKRFKKSISKMTKTDLEELILQKIVEAIVHKSEFSEMRDLIEKQEKIIATHRTKIAEITKQFRDLEMVHNRVLKDLETKNQQFIMPVKITRAVGLQVLIPKRLEQSGAKAAVDRPAGTAPATPQPPVNNTYEGVKRKCAQKITPLRPDTTQQSPISVTRTVPAQNGINSTSSTAQSSAPSTPQNQVKVQQKIINRNTSATPITPQQNIVNVISQQAAATHYVVQQATLNQINTSSPAMQTVRKSTTSMRPTQPAV